MAYPFIDRDKINVTIEKILGPESSPSFGRRLIKFQSSNQRNSWSSQIHPVRNVPSGLFGTRFLARQSVDSGKKIVPSVATDRNGQNFMSRQERGITVIEYSSLQKFGNTEGVLALLTRHLTG